MSVIDRTTETPKALPSDTNALQQIRSWQAELNKSKQLIDDHHRLHEEVKQHRHRAKTAILKDFRGKILPTSANEVADRSQNYDFLAELAMEASLTDAELAINTDKIKQNNEKGTDQYFRNLIGSMLAGRVVEISPIEDSNQNPNITVTYPVKPKGIKERVGTILKLLPNKQSLNLRPERFKGQFQSVDIESSRVIMKLTSNSGLGEAVVRNLVDSETLNPGVILRLHE